MMRTSLILLFLVCCLVGCDDQLDVTPENSLTFVNALSSPQEFESAINGIEGGVKRYMSVGDPVHQEMKGIFYDEVASWGDKDVYMDYTSDELYSCMPNWQVYYEVIASTNSVLNYVDAAGLTRERRDLYKGQTLFFKALTYLKIIQNWGDCMLIRDNVELLPTAKTPWEEVAGYAIDLAREAVELLPEFDQMKNWKGKNYTYKATPCKGAANALLAYLCAWKAGGKYFANNQDYDENKLWQEAEKACTSIINSGMYDLATDPEEVCTSVLVENSRESIYETINIGYTQEGLMGKDYCTVFLAYMSSYSMWPMTTTGIPEDINYAQYKIRASTVKMMYAGSDTRKDAYFYKLDSMSKEPVSQGYAYFYKYRKPYIEMQGGYTISIYQNKVWWRLADIYLLRAECRARLGGENLTGAIADLNKIRERANAKLYESSEYGGDLQYAIFKEREKELLIEGYRYFDIIRNGYVNRELNGNFKTLSVQDMKDGALFLLINESAMRGNPLMRQNTYWHRKL